MLIIATVFFSGNILDACSTLRSIEGLSHRPGVVSIVFLGGFKHIKHFY